MICSFSVSTTEHLKREIESFKTMSVNDHEYHKKKTWLDFVLRVPNCVKDFPINKNMTKKELSEFSNKLRKSMNRECFGMETVKEKIIDYVFKRIANPNSNKHILALVAPAGCGKSSISKSLSKVLDLPIIKLSLAGVSDECILTGHSVTYTGSVPGQIMKGIVESKCLNPIIYLDEVDKTGRNHSTDEVSNALINILDSTNNNKFLDNYVGFECDIESRVLILRNCSLRMFLANAPNQNWTVYQRAIIIVQSGDDANSHT